MIWIGTSGYQYPEWKGTFYPEELSAKKMLGYYSNEFSTTEINYTFYRMPTAETLLKWFDETPNGFRFSLKAPQAITHKARLKNCSDTVDFFWETAQHLKDKLGVILFQLPPFLRKDETLLKDFLTSLRSDMLSAFEFRHESWFNDNVFSLLSAKNVALCIADSEKLSTPPVFTATHGYFRLRDEGYKGADIARWGKLISEQEKLKDIYVYFKHEESGVGPQFAKMLRKTLRS